MEQANNQAPCSISSQHKSPAPDCVSLPRTNYYRARACESAPPNSSQWFIIPRKEGGKASKAGRQDHYPTKNTPPPSPFLSFLPLVPSLPQLCTRNRTYRTPHDRSVFLSLSFLFFRFPLQLCVAIAGCWLLLLLLCSTVLARLPVRLLACVASLALLNGQRLSGDDNTQVMERNDWSTASCDIFIYIYINIYYTQVILFFFSISTFFSSALTDGELSLSLYVGIPGFVSTCTLLYCTAPGFVMECNIV